MKNAFIRLSSLNVEGAAIVSKDLTRGGPFQTLERLGYVGRRIILYFQGTHLAVGENQSTSCLPNRETG